MAATIPHMFARTDRTAFRPPWLLRGAHRQSVVASMAIRQPLVARRAADFLAVCNEVAEHIQHLRGQSPDGGLTAKPKWYQGQQDANPQAAYFEKPEKPEDGPLFKQGASILWLRFVSKEPNAWQVADPIVTKKGGYGVLPPSFPNSSWSYNRAGPITRTRMVTGEKGAQVRVSQWLRWIHEATVVEVAETAEGTVVLTFETPCPATIRAFPPSGYSSITWWGTCCRTAMRRITSLPLWAMCRKDPALCPGAPVWTTPDAWNDRLFCSGFAGFWDLPALECLRTRATGQVTAWRAGG